VNWIHLAQVMDRWRALVGSCEDGNEPSSSAKGRDLLDYLSVLSAFQGLCSMELVTSGWCIHVRTLLYHFILPCVVNLNNFSLVTTATATTLLLLQHYYYFTTATAVLLLLLLQLQQEMYSLLRSCIPTYLSSSSNLFNDAFSASQTI
jgi:hypothetical protein